MVLRVSTGIAIGSKFESKSYWLGAKHIFYFYHANAQANIDTRILIHISSYWLPFKIINAILVNNEIIILEVLIAIYIYIYIYIYI